MNGINGLSVRYVILYVISSYYVDIFLLKCF